MMENDERREILKFNQKEKDFRIEKLARMLIVFSKILQSNYIFKEVFNLQESLNQGLARGLLKLLKADNVIITYLSS